MVLVLALKYVYGSLKKKRFEFSLHRNLIHCVYHLIHFITILSAANDYWKWWVKFKK